MNRASIITAGILLALFFVCLASSFKFPRKCPPKCVREFLRYHNFSGSRLDGLLKQAQWDYMMKPTARTQCKLNIRGDKYARWKKRTQEFARKLRNTCLSKSQARQLQFIKPKNEIESKKENREINVCKSQMFNFLKRATMVRKNNQRLEGQIDVKTFFRENKDYDALAEVWTLWRDKAGRPLRPFFQKMVKFQTAFAKKNNYSDYGSWLQAKKYEDPRLNEKVMDMFADIFPLYKELHAYVRFKLAAKYPKRFDPKGSIPAHILGCPWAKSWQNIFDLVAPYPNAQSTDVTAEMRRQNWTVMRMFKTTEQFFVSLGLPKMTPKFWKYSMMKKKKGYRGSCHAVAKNMISANDFRIRMCVRVNQDDLQTIHHEMGHVIYFMLNAHLPFVYRGIHNRLIHESVGDSIALSANSIQHLAKLGLVNSSRLTKEVEINALMRMALERLAFLPYGLALDTWRWRIYNGTIKASEYNQGWWRLRRDLQGLEPPVARTEKDFDAGAKYHVANDRPYIPYFIAYFLQFQFYEAMCKASGHQGPLYKCDFYQSKAAGDLMRSALSLGSSKPWKETIRRMTGQPEVSTAAIKRYFAPLFVWLRTYRRAHEYPIGW